MHGCWAKNQRMDFKMIQSWSSFVTGDLGDDDMFWCCRRAILSCLIANEIPLEKEGENISQKWKLPQEKEGEKISQKWKLLQAGVISWKKSL